MDRSATQTIVVNNGGEINEMGFVDPSTVGSLTMNDGTFMVGELLTSTFTSVALSNHSTLEAPFSPDEDLIIGSATVDDSTIMNIANIHSLSIGTLTVTDGGFVEGEHFTGHSVDIESGKLDGGNMNVDTTMTIRWSGSPG